MWGPTPWIFLAPYLFFFVAFGLLPAAYAVITSFTSTGADGSTAFSGFANWFTAFTDFRFLGAVTDVVKYLVLMLPTLTLVVMSLALVLHARPGFVSTTMRTIYFLPNAVSGAAAALVWLFMFSASVSPAGPILHALNLNYLTIVVSGNRLPFLFALMSLPLYAGGWIVIMYGAMASLSEEILQASLIDGATALQRAIYIELPLIRRYIVLMLITTFAVGTQVFVEPALFDIATQGGVGPTWSVNQLAYYFASQRADFGAAAAVSLTVLLVGVVVALVAIFRTDFYRVEG